MQIPLQITFDGVEPSDAVATAVRERAAKLDRYCGGRLISCRVIIREPNHRRNQGDLFMVTIDVTLPGAELAVGHPSGHGDGRAHENVYVAIRDAFQAMERQVKEWSAMRRQPGRVHHAPAKPHAKVTRFFPQDGYGFITTEDGRDIYFHTNAVINDGADTIEVGSEVRFTEELGDKGPQATTVECVSRRQAQQAAG